MAPARRGRWPQVDAGEQATIRRFGRSPRMLPDSWTFILRVVIVGTLAYASLVLLLRISGKRTLTKLNAFDLVVTVALGSTLATILLNRDVSLVEGVLAFAVLLALQFCITWLSVRWPAFGQLVKSEPSLLLHQGRFLDRTMKSQRVTRSEVLAALRSAGVARIEDAGAVVLETDGSLSVIQAKATAGRPADALGAMTDGGR